MRSSFKLISGLLIYLLISTPAWSIIDEVLMMSECPNNFSNYFDSANTCESAKKLLKDNPIVANVGNKRLERIKGELGKTLVKDTFLSAKRFGSIDQFFQMLGSDERLSEINNCSVEKVFSGLNCSNDVNAKSVLAGTSFKNLDSFKKGYSSYFKKQVNATVTRNLEDCLPDSVNREVEWQKYKAVGHASLIKALKTLRDSDSKELNWEDIRGNSAFISLNKLYPNIINDLEQGYLLLPSEDTYSLEPESFFKKLLLNNKEAITSSMSNSCEKLKGKLSNGLCKEVVGHSLSKSSNESLFKYSLEGDGSNYVYDEFAEDDRENNAAFLHYAASCMSEKCADDKCINYDDFMSSNYNAVDVNSIRTSDLSDLAAENEGEICKQLNCANHREVLASQGKVECKKRDAMEIPSLEKEFGCEANADLDICTTLRAITVVKTRKVSSFTRTFLGMSDADVKEVEAQAETTSIEVDDSDGGALDEFLASDSARGEEYVAKRKKSGYAKSSGRKTKFRRVTQGGRKGRAGQGHSVRDVAAVNGQQYATAVETGEDEEESEDEEMSDADEKLVSSFRSAIDNALGLAKKKTKRLAKKAKSFVSSASVGEQVDQNVLDSGDGALGGFDDVRPTSASVVSNTNGVNNRPGGGAARSIASSGSGAAVGSLGGGGGALGATGGSAGESIRNIGYTEAVEGGDVIPTLALNESRLTSLDEAAVENLVQGNSDLFALKVNVDGNEVVVRVKKVVDKSGQVYFEPIFNGGDESILDKLRDAPLFRGFFEREVYRVRKLNDALRDL